MDKFPSEPVKVMCLQCSGSTFHDVLKSVDNFYTEPEDFPFETKEQNQLIQCRGCHAFSYRIAHILSSDHDRLQDRGGNDYYRLTEKLYPPRLENIRSLDNEDQLYLPKKVNLIYQETLSALSIPLAVLAGIGLRALLETICKERCAQGDNLSEKIDNLVTQQILTPENAAILHKIRTLGNNAAHEVQPHSATQLALAMNIVEHLLNNVYILPQKVTVAFPNP